MQVANDTGSPPWGLDSINPISLVDPLSHDLPTDEAVLTTRRALCRIATVAAEAGARFQRDGIGVDPMAWMLAPRRMFQGAAPIDACMKRTPFLRGVLVHGLTLDLDMDAEDVDELLDDDLEHDDLNGSAIELGDRRVARSQERPVPKLFTATLACLDGDTTVHAFHASVSLDRNEVVRRLAHRMGGASAAAVIVEGFDVSDPMVEALVAPAVADMLRLIAQDPVSPLAAGLDLNVEQRFHG